MSIRLSAFGRWVDSTAHILRIYYITHTHTHTHTNTHRHTHAHTRARKWISLVFVPGLLDKSSMNILDEYIRSTSYNTRVPSDGSARHIMQAGMYVHRMCIGRVVICKLTCSNMQADDAYGCRSALKRNACQYMPLATCSYMHAEESCWYALALKFVCNTQRAATRRRSSWATTSAQRPSHTFSGSPKEKRQASR